MPLRRGKGYYPSEANHYACPKCGRPMILREGPYEGKGMYKCMYDGTEWSKPKNGDD